MREVFQNTILRQVLLIKLESKQKQKQEKSYQLINMDITSLQSIEEQLHQVPFEPSISKSEYLRNLKSQCLYRQNAIKTAQILIEEYYHENQQLKLQVMRLHQKIQNYEERIQILKNQIDSHDITNSKNYQKELFQSSLKLSQVLQKYSQLQQKYHYLQKQFLKLKNKQNQQTNKQNQKIQAKLKHQEQKQNQLKMEIQKQFNNFLKTPTNKITSRQVNLNAQTQKKSFSKNRNQKIYHNEHICSSDDQPKPLNIFNSKNNKKNITQSIYEVHEDYIQRFPYHPSQFNKIAQDKIYVMQYKNKNQFRKSSDKNQLKLMKKLKVLEWKIKQKDQEILLMLRRNKEIEGKYSLLKQILQQQYQSPCDQSEDKLQTIDVKMYRNNQRSQRKKRASEMTKNSYRKGQSSNDQRSYQHSQLIQRKKSTHMKKKPYQQL